MANSISVTAVSRAASASAPERPANLDAELAKAQSQLADWVACPSCKTPEGKAKIEEISAKVDSIKSKMEAVENGRSPAAGAAPAPDVNTAGSRSGSALSTLGGVVDVYA